MQTSVKLKERKRDAQRFSAAELRAARAERIHVGEAEPYGWIAFSEDDRSQPYHLFCEPHSKRLICTCADFIFRGDSEPNYECKHVSATLKAIARKYLATEYDPHKQNARP